MKEKRRYITYRVRTRHSRAVVLLGMSRGRHPSHFYLDTPQADSTYLRDRFIASRNKRSRECCGEGFVRCVNLTKFCLVFTGALLQALVRTGWDAAAAICFVCACVAVCVRGETLDELALWA